MRPLRFVCLFVILSSLQVLAQSSRAPLVNQPNGMPIAQQRHPALPPNVSQMPQGAPFAQHGARAFKETATRRGNSSSGLNFANAVAYDSGGYTATSVAVADVNGDGKPDLLVANYCAVSGNCSDSNGTVGVLLGNGDGTFQTAISLQLGWLGCRLGSGGGRKRGWQARPGGGERLCKLQFLFQRRGRRRGRAAGKRRRNLPTSGELRLGRREAYSVAVADVNGDGKPDLRGGEHCANSNCGDGTVNGTSACCWATAMEPSNRQ